MIADMDPATMWGSGNYAAVADKISAVGEHVVEAVGLGRGWRRWTSPVAAGNATIPAARAGARVTGADFSPDLLAIARERAADAMVEIEWVEADAQAAAVRGRELRSRDLDLRPHVRRPTTSERQPR